MMRKKLQKMTAIAALLALAMAFAMVTVGCPEPDEDPPPPPVSAKLRGSWAHKSETSIVILEFTANRLNIYGTDRADYYASEVKGKIKIGKSSDNVNQDFCISYQITNDTLTLTGGTSADSYPSVVFCKAHALTANEWKDGEITDGSNGEAWYSIPVNMNTSYNIWLNESNPNGNGVKTLDVSLSGFYNDGKTSFYTTTTAWVVAESFSASTGGLVYLRVTPTTSGETGTFGIVYNTGGMMTQRPAAPFNPPATPLTANEWKDGVIAGSSGGVAWYSLTVASDSTYYFWWNEAGANNGNGLKTLNVSVSAYNSDGTAISAFNDVSTAWASAKSFTPAASGTVYLKVTPNASGDTGSFGIVYSETNTRPGVTFNPPNPTPLTADEWKDGEITGSIPEVWYSFDVTSEETYRVWWNDSRNGNNTKTADVRVSGFYHDGSVISTLNNIDDGWTSNVYTQNSFTPTATQAGTVYLRVTPYNSSNIGTFGIVYNTSDTRPLVPVVLPATATPLTADVWADGEITSSSREVWYSFPVSSSTTYRVWWNEQVGQTNNGDGTKTLDIVVSAWYGSNRENIFDSVDLGWNSTQSFSPSEDDTVYVKVLAYSSTGTGTFGIVYNADSATRPPIPIYPVSPSALTADQWEDGEITSSVREVWYSFDVTSGTLYRVWLNEGGDSTHGDGSKTLDATVNLYYTDGTIISRIFSAWQPPLSGFTAALTDTVYVKVVPNYSSDRGTFGIVYNADSATRPPIPINPVDPTTLTEGVWESGNIPTSSGEQWFTFTATATAWRYIHVTLDTLSDLYVQLYESDGTMIGNRTNLWSGSLYVSQPVTSGQVYYIKVSPHNGSGNYQIALNTSSTPPASP